MTPCWENVMTGGFLRHVRVKDVRLNAEEVLAFTGLNAKQNFNAQAFVAFPTRNGSKCPWPAMEPELLEMLALTEIRWRGSRRWN